MGRRPGQHAGRSFLLIVVDSSVWINHLRNRETPQVRWLRMTGMLSQSITVGDVIMLEVLQGAQEAQAEKIERLLRRFTILPMLDGESAVRAARNYRLLRQRGVTIRRTVDMIIGTFCIDRGLSLLHEDSDFDHMEQHLGLAVVPT